MRLRLFIQLIRIVAIAHLLISCNAYFENKEREKAEKDFQISDEGLPTHVLDQSNIVSETKEKDIGDIEDDLVISLDVSDVEGSQQVNIFREESRVNQLARVEVEVNQPYPHKLNGELKITSLGRVDYLKYPVLIEGKIVNDRGDKLLDFRKYLPLVFKEGRKSNISGENSPIVKFAIWNDVSKLQPSTFLLHAELKVKVLDIKSGVDVLNISDFNSISIKEETTILSNPLRIILK